MPDVMIIGWMQEAERLALRRWAFGLDVLELGSYLGLSTAQLLATGKSVAAVDTFDGRGTPEPKDCKDQFHLNMKATGNYGKLATWPGEFSEVLPKMLERGYSYDLIFIDGAHDYASVRQDLQLALPLLKHGGLIAFHDHDDGHPGVVATVKELAGMGWYCAEQANSLVLMKQGRVPPRPKPRIAGIMPHRNGTGCLGSAWGMDAWFSQKYNRQVYNRGTSVLTRTFNELLCDALNEQKEFGYTHVAMLHNDVIPCRFWVDILMEELERRDLDMLSVIIPLKDHRGLTSTGLDTVGNPWTVRRFTMKEVFELPDTFTAYDVPYRTDGQDLLLNTGAWLMRFDRPWKDGLCFRQQDHIGFHEASGKHVAMSISEDWDWARQLTSRGCRLGATRKVGVVHEHAMYHNNEPWGTWATDEDFFKEQFEAKAYEESLAKKALVG